MQSKSAVGKSNGNVFADLGLPNAEEELRKADAAILVVGLIQDKKLTQAEAAKLLGLKQPDVSNLMRGRLDGFSFERLLTMMLYIGLDIQIVAAPAPKTRTGKLNFVVKRTLRPKAAAKEPREVVAA